MDLIERYYFEMASGLLTRSRSPGIDVWPQPVFNPADGNECIHSLVFSELSQKLDEKGSLHVKQGSCGPSHLTHILYLSLSCTKDLQEKRKRLKVISAILETIKEMRNGDTWCEKGNLLWNTRNIRNYMKESKDVGACGKAIVARTLAMLSGFLEMTFFCNLAFGREIHGPYKHEGDIAIVREFYDYHPPFWKMPKVQIPQQIVVIGRYAPMDVKFDFVGRMFTAGNLKEDLRGVSVLINGELQKNPIGTLSDIEAPLKAALVERGEEIAQYVEKDLVRRYCQSTLWAIRIFWEFPMKKFENLRKKLDISNFHNNGYMNKIFRKVGNIVDIDKATKYLATQFNPENCDESI